MGNYLNGEILDGEQNIASFLHLRADQAAGVKGAIIR